MEMYDYDAILGMDWLNRYNVVIDCKKNKVIFLPPGEKEVFEFHGTSRKQKLPIISAIKACKMLASRCVEYPVSVIDTNK